MKKPFLIMLLGMPFMVSANCSLIYGGYQSGMIYDGPTTCSGEVEAIKVNGPLTLTNATIASANVEGDIAMANSQVGNLTVKGAVTMNDSKIDSLNIDGVLKANRSTVSDITAEGDLYLIDSKAGIITVNAASADTVYKLYLQGKTIVFGNISFNQNNGIIYEDETVHIQGNVAGATMKYNMNSPQ